MEIVDYSGPFEPGDATSTSGGLRGELRIRTMQSAVAAPRRYPVFPDPLGSDSSAPFRSGDFVFGRTRSRRVLTFSGPLGLFHGGSAREDEEMKNWYEPSVTVPDLVVTPEMMKLLHYMEMQGVWCSFGDPSPFHDREINIKPAEMQEFLRSPDAFRAKRHGVSKEEYLHFVNSDFGAVQCAAIKRDGKPCRFEAYGADDSIYAYQWIARHGSYCPLHRRLQTAKSAKPKPIIARPKPVCTDGAAGLEEAGPADVSDSSDRSSSRV
jgi:hypothetical protein